MARYIDAEKLEKAISQPHIYDINRDDVIALVAEQPSADVVEVKHGYWRDNIQKFTSPAGVTKDFLAGYNCSACGRTEIKKEPYCHCGAKMDGRGEQDER